jgi:hypothetical protein
MRSVDVMWRGGAKEMDRRDRQTIFAAQANTRRNKAGTRSARRSRRRRIDRRRFQRSGGWDCATSLMGGKF